MLRVRLEANSDRGERLERKAAERKLLLQTTPCFLLLDVPQREVVGLIFIDFYTMVDRMMLWKPLYIN